MKETVTEVKTVTIEGNHFAEEKYFVEGKANDLIKAILTTGWLQFYSLGKKWTEDHDELVVDYFIRTNKKIAINKIAIAKLTECGEWEVLEANEAE